MHALYFQLSNGLWFPLYQTLSAWSVYTVWNILNYVCTLFNKLPGNSSVFICLSSIALSWITSSLLKIPIHKLKNVRLFLFVPIYILWSYRHDLNYRIVFKISIYDQIGPTLNPDPITTNFTIRVNSLMDIITMHFGFFKYIWKKRRSSKK